MPDKDEGLKVLVNGEWVEASKELKKTVESIDEGLKHRLDRPNWEKIAEFLYHIKYASSAWLTAPPELKEHYRTLCYELSALIPDEEEIRKQILKELLGEILMAKTEAKCEERERVVKEIERHIVSNDIGQLIVIIGEDTHLAPRDYNWWRNLKDT